MRIRDAQASDWAGIRTLLDAAGLPTDDLEAGTLHGFLVATGKSESDVLGVIGCQVLSSDLGLVRSLVVRSPARGAGLGAQLVLEAEATALKAGLCEVWLLTIDANEFFNRQGYIAAERKNVPPVVQLTPEFSGLCPADAFVMYKSLMDRPDPL